jgi:hypothetical protein
MNTVMLPVVFTPIGRELPFSPLKYFAATNRTNYSSLVKHICSMVGANEEDITIYFERAGTEEIVRLVDCTNLIHERATCIMVCVGLPPGCCKVCEKASNHCMIPDFHCCIEDEIVVDFRTSVGPIQRPPRGEV